MTIPVMPPFVPPVGPVPQITPLTYRDGLTYLRKLDDIQEYINKQLIPYVESTVGQMYEDLETAVFALNDAVTAAQQAAADAAASAQGIDDAIAAAVNDLTVQVNAAVAAAQAAQTAAETASSDSINAKNAAEAAVIAAQTAQAAAEQAVTDINALIADKIDADDAAALVDSLIDADLKKFDLETATVKYEARTGGTNTTRVSQAVYVSDALNGEIFTTYAMDGTVGGRDTVRICRASPAGRIYEQMEITDGGHATNFFIEVDNAGSIWVWSIARDYNVTPGILGHYNYVRMPWAPGTYDWSTVAIYKVPALSRTNYLRATFDEYNEIVGVVEDTGVAGQALLTTHTLADIKAGNWNPVHSTLYTYPANHFTQGWAYYDGFWYILGGSSEETIPYDPATIMKINADTGALVYNKSIEHTRLGIDGSKFGGFSEPEGLSFAMGRLGQPSLVYTMVNGPSGGRTITVWSVSMDKGSPFTSARRYEDVDYGDTVWNGYPMETWYGDFAPSTGLTSGFQIRVAGGKLQMRGTVTGTFVADKNIVGQLRDGFYSENGGLMRGIATKSVNSNNDHHVARVEVDSTGEVSVWLPLSATASVAWVDFQFDAYIR